MSTVKVFASAVVLPKVAHIEYVPGGDPLGRCNRPLNEPFLNGLACASGTIEQKDSIIYPKDTCSPSGSGQPEPLTEIVVPTGPEEGLLLMLSVMDSRSACTGVTNLVVA